MASASLLTDFGTTFKEKRILGTCGRKSLDNHDPPQWREGADPPDVHGPTWTSGKSSKYNNRCLKQKIPTKEWKYLGALFSLFRAGNLQGKKKFDQKTPSSFLSQRLRSSWPTSCCVNVPGKPIGEGKPRWVVGGSVMASPQVGIHVNAGIAAEKFSRENP